jgi:shikimate dehydrogenase
MNPAPPLAGVIGWPIAHSRSPRLHGHWLRRYDITGYYIPLAIAPEALADALDSLADLRFRGVNVTIPHKEAALALARTVSEAAAAIGAANTLTFDPEDGFHADNTDGYGFLQNVRQAAPGWSAAEGPALVLGAGGSARAIVHALLSDGAPEVRITNRTAGRAASLCDHFGPRVVAVDWAGAPEAVAGAATIVNTTALGMSGQPPLGLCLEGARDAAVVADIVYAPLETPLLAEAAERGLRAVDGLGMLLHQAAPGFESWFGRRPEVDAGLRVAVLQA